MTGAVSMRAAACEGQPMMAMNIINTISIITTSRCKFFAIDVCTFEWVLNICFSTKSSLPYQKIPKAVDLLTKPTASHALAWAEQGQNTAAVVLTAQRLIHLQDIVAKQLPMPMRQGFAVAQVKGNELTLIAEHAALAAKLRQLTPRLLKQINESGWQATSLKIKVATRPNAPPAHQVLKQAVPLDANALSHFEQLREQIRPGPLTQAIDRLLSRHRS